MVYKTAFIECWRAIPEMRSIACLMAGNARADSEKFFLSFFNEIEITKQTIYYKLFTRILFGLASCLYTFED
jgi:hypothetical protein